MRARRRASGGVPDERRTCTDRCESQLLVEPREYGAVLLLSLTGCTRTERASERGCVDPRHRRSKTMRRNPPTSIGVVACGIVLAAGAVAGFTPAGASTPPNAVQSAVQSVESATSAAIAQVTQPAPAATPAAACRRSCSRCPGRDTGDQSAGASDRAAALDLDPDHGARQRDREHTAARAERDDRDQHDDTVVARGQCQCTGERLLALHRAACRCQQQLLDQLRSG